MLRAAPLVYLRALAQSESGESDELFQLLHNLVRLLCLIGAISDDIIIKCDGREFGKRKLRSKMSKMAQSKNRRNESSRDEIRRRQVVFGKINLLTLEMEQSHMRSRFSMRVPLLAAKNLCCPGFGLILESLEDLTECLFAVSPPLGSQVKIRRQAKIGRQPRLLAPAVLLLR